MNKPSFDDTILWSEESDYYTRRAFEGEDDPYNNTDRKSSIEIISKLFEVNSFKPQSILHIGCSGGFSFSFYQEYFQNEKLYGIDPGKESIQIAKDKFSERGGSRI